MSEKNKIDKINEIVNNPEIFAKQADRILATIKAEIIKTACMKEACEKEESLKKILENMQSLLFLTAIQGTRSHKESIIFFIEMVYSNTPDSQSAKRATLLKIRERLLYLLKGTIQGVMSESGLNYRKEKIDKLKSELEAVEIEKELITEIMDEVYLTLRQLSTIIADYIRKEGEDKLVKADMGLGYLSLIPGITEEEIKNFLKPDGLNDPLQRSREKYLLAIKRPAPLIGIGQNILGIYAGNPIVAKIKEIGDYIICDIYSNGMLEQTEIRFDPVTLMSTDRSGFLWQAMSDINWINPENIKPKTGDASPKYSIATIVRWEAEEKEHIGIGYFNFGVDYWTIAIQNSIACVTVPAKKVIAWIDMPIDLKDKLEGYHY